MSAILRSLERVGVSLAAAPQPVPATVAPQAEAPDAGAQASASDASEALKKSGALAVLPFDNISPDEKADYFSDGLTEELIARLSLVKEIELVSRWASMQFKDAKKDIKAVGRELGARYIVGGGVRKFQDSVRITVQLVDVVTNRPDLGRHLQGQARRHLRDPGTGRKTDRRGVEAQAHLFGEAFAHQASD